MQSISRNSIIIAILSIDLIATIFACYNPNMQDKLFELYLGSTAGLYGYVHQESGSKISEITSEEDDKSKM